MDAERDNPIDSQNIQHHLIKLSFLKAYLQALFRILSEAVSQGDKFIAMLNACKKGGEKTFCPLYGVCECERSLFFQSKTWKAKRSEVRDFIDAEPTNSKAVTELLRKAERLEEYYQALQRIQKRKIRRAKIEAFRQALVSQGEQ